ncbi:hypothetical protein LZ30DRAFT_743486 [Colletotrichum cereale]|nr:hypothetical protein LZ30DRAFT_743486 [Colletotrichum cereale]
MPAHPRVRRRRRRRRLRRPAHCLPVQAPVHTSGSGSAAVSWRRTHLNTRLGTSVPPAPPPDIACFAHYSISPPLQTGSAAFEPPSSTGCRIQQAYRHGLGSSSGRRRCCRRLQQICHPLAGTGLRRRGAAVVGDCGC